MAELSKKGSRAMMVMKIISVASITGSAIAAQIDPFQMGAKLGGMSSSNILGVVAVVSVCINAFLFRAKEKDVETARKAHDGHTEKLYAMIENNTRAAQAHADGAQSMAAVLVELKDTVKDCRNKG